MASFSSIAWLVLSPSMRYPVLYLSLSCLIHSTNDVASWLSPCPDNGKASYPLQSCLTTSYSVELSVPCLCVCVRVSYCCRCRFQPLHIWLSVMTSVRFWSVCWAANRSWCRVWGLVWLFTSYSDTCVDSIEALQSGGFLCHKPSLNYF